MKKLWVKYKFIIIALFVWRLFLFFIEKAAPFPIPLHLGYNGPLPWANHDGLLYLRIAQFGYFEFTEAFFPVYPLLIRLLSQIFPYQPAEIGMGISLVSFITGVLLFYTYLLKEKGENARWSVLFLISFPTSFFFTAVYPTSLFFLLTIGIVIAARSKNWLLCGILGAFASGTSIFGLCLFVYAAIEFVSQHPKKIVSRELLSISLMPLGLLLYMIFLYCKHNDPLYFFHLQPLFGANRSGSHIILLPQVFWRYGKILFTAFLKPTPVSYFITIIECITTVFGFVVLWVGYRMKERWSYLLYGFFALILPTLTGTLSSMPRYILHIFPIFIILARIHTSVIKYAMVIIFILLQMLLAALFLRGWFVA